MDSRSTIKHAGVVRAIQGNSAEVEIVNSSACSSCKARSMCNASESKTKVVDALLPMGQPVDVGQQVDVVGEERMGMTAVLLAYVLPLILMLIVLIVAKNLGYGDAQGGLAALGVLVPYYAVLYIFRSQIGKKIIFTIELKNQ
ncbi:MAG: SoxR reducing system RseC family protein [Bacteroidales bacterium]|nr:SoxR reducing system RseC family protein [Bacteroidales bacterium]